MPTFDTPYAIRPLEKLIMDFSYANGYDPLNVFRDFLAYIIHGFSPDAPSLHNWKYKRQQNVIFMNMVIEWTQLMQREIQDDTDWYDPFGDLYMALASRGTQQSQGQFFTPVHICDLMVMCSDTGEKKTGRE
ncbi:type I restriction enzyme [Bacteroides reticulotermitis JCM 10512]|uniref:Type I restriction enzyme n=1 Tax=Bacteroides reticulotermitis JCM 10512 TaxID=1445607 RepID=W4UVN6_9BACE|nr:type I restriction enzyme [Bacteroides reticulotermitis JCM 10512]